MRKDDQMQTEAGNGTPDKPSVARMYDYFLGGFHNVAIDRQAAEAVLRVFPEASLALQANRAFLRRAVNFLIAQGIDQFLDIGSGIPSVGNVHEVAQHINPAARVVYVDSDPVAVEHSNAILADNIHALAIEADARQPERLLQHPDIQRLLDFRRPIGVLIVALLHFLPNDADAYGLVRAVRDALAPGSYIAITHGTADAMPPDIAAQTEQLYAGTSNPGKYRSRSAVEGFFAGLTLVEPGVVYVPLWRPEGPDDLFMHDPERSINFAGVGYKP